MLHGRISPVLGFAEKESNLLLTILEVLFLFSVLFYEFSLLWLLIDKIHWQHRPCWNRSSDRTTWARACLNSSNCHLKGVYLIQLRAVPVYMIVSPDIGEHDISFLCVLRVEVLLKLGMDYWKCRKHSVTLVWISQNRFWSQVFVSANPCLYEHGKNDVL